MTSTDRDRAAIARLLSGDAVSPEELRSAIAGTENDAAYRGYLRAVHGLSTDAAAEGVPENGPAGEAECQTFQDEAAEFLEVPETRRQERFPEHVAHLARCESCRALLSRVRPWVDAPSSAAPGPRRMLVEPIRVASGPHGLVNRSSFAAAAALQTTLGSGALVAGAAQAPSESAEPAVRHLRFLLEDEMLATLIELELEMLEQGRVAVRCGGGLPPGGGPTNVRIELRSSGDFLPVISTTLDRFASGHVLSPGQWTVSLQWDDGGPAWELPLAIEDDSGTNPSL